MASLTRPVGSGTAEKIVEVQKITGSLRMPALYALIEAARAGGQGRDFSVVAAEVREMSGAVGHIAERLSVELAERIQALKVMTLAMTSQAAGQRLVDLALKAVEIMDRNLYERTCDVRWWATDAARVEALAAPNPDRLAHASRRLGVIIGAYTVYLDLRLCDTEGRIVANGRADRFPVAGQSVRNEPWFTRAMQLASGDDFAVADIATSTMLGGAQVATYATAVREDAAMHGRPLGVLGIHFDWEPQARTICQGVRLTEDEARRSRVMLVVSRQRIIASSDGKGVLASTLAFETEGRSQRFVSGRDGTTAAFHLTPGYETYRGLGWYGVIQQRAVGFRPGRQIGKLGVASRIGKTFAMTAAPRILYARDQHVAAAEFQTLLGQCTLGAIRPAQDLARLEAMLRGANLIVTARRGAGGPLVGIARCVTDFSWCCYLSDLAVSDAAQGLGIGRGLLDETRRIIGPEVSLMLVSVPEAVGFYRRAGMAEMPDGFVFKRER